MNRRQTITLALALLLAPTFAAAESTPDLDELWRIVQQQQRTIQTLTEKLDGALRALDRTETRRSGCADQLFVDSVRAHRESLPLQSPERNEAAIAASI